MEQEKQIKQIKAGLKSVCPNCDQAYLVRTSLPGPDDSCYLYWQCPVCGFEAKKI